MKERGATMETMRGRQKTEIISKRAGLLWQDLPFVEGERSGDLLGSEGASMVLFIEQLDPEG